MGDMKRLSEEEWKKKLTPEQYRVLREKGTEAPFSSDVFTNNEQGVYVCAACGHELFESSAKFELDKWDPNYGWPSFDKPVNRENIELREDNTLGMQRTEVICKNCGSHLGHLFNDRSNASTGEDYCVNGCALIFKPKK